MNKSVTHIIDLESANGAGVIYNRIKSLCGISVASLEDFRDEPTCQECLTIEHNLIIIRGRDK